MKKLGFAFLSTVSFLAQGCSSSYEPAQSPRIALVYDGGQVAFLRDGKRHQGFLIGGSLLEAVEGDPEAERVARTARNLEIGGYVFAFGGLAPLVGAAVVQGSSHPVDQHEGAVTALLLSSLACEFVSLGLTLSAVPRFYDAINIYNDHVDRTLLPSAPSPPPLRLAPPSASVAPPSASVAPSSAPAVPASVAPAAPNSASFPPE